MTKFKLYYSGIHISDIYFQENKVSFTEKDMISGNFSREKIMSEEDGSRFKGEYLINPLDLKKNIYDKSSIFFGDKKGFTTEDGQVYEKHEEKPNLWARRDGTNPTDVLVVDNQIQGFITNSRELTTVLVREGYEGHTPLAYWENPVVSRADYLVEARGTFMVAMRDGVRLATEVWLPKDIGHKAPTILIRTCYGRKRNLKSYFRYVARGYALVVQDTRGREDSEGEWIPMHYEIEDGDDTLNWIKDQEWSDGSIGTIGGSYLGYVQWAAAASGNKHLKAIVSIVTAGSAFTDIPRKGGALVSGTLAWAFAMADKNVNFENLQRDDWDEIVKIRPIKDIVRRALGKDVDFWDKWLSEEVEGDFWSKSNWYKDRDRIDVPAMIVSGWYDDNSMGTTEACQIVENYDRGNKKIILGPWMHNANSRREINGVSFANNALRDDLDFTYQLWFDRQLKGIENGVDKGYPVEYYIVGEDKWVTSSNWPPENSKLTDMYISSDGKANTSSGDGRLEFERTEKTGVDSYIFDPDNPAPHLINMSDNELGLPEDYREMERRDDVLVYSSDILTEDLIIAGDVYVEFYASSSAKDTDWVVRLTDVGPDGSSFRLCDGILRAKFRNGFDKIDLLETDKIEKYRIKTSKISNTFKKGHRIRLQITSGAENYIFPNPNTGKSFFEDVEVIKASQRVYHGGDYQSRVILPIIE